MIRHLSFKLISLLYACIACDAQYQRTDNIAIQKEHYFWQLPSEPLRIVFKARLDSLNAIDERPYPLELIIFNVVDGRTRAQTSYLLVQSDSVIIEQQCLSVSTCQLKSESWIELSHHECN
jgi:hypothetical protein